MMLDGMIRLVAWTQNDSYKSLEEVLSIPEEKWKEKLQEYGVTNYVLISTCNRFEIYYSSPADLNGIFKEESALKMSGSQALEHLFRVTAGLESMSVGEHEILHQVKEAFDKATSEKHAHDPLAFIFRRALSSGKLVRKDTDISKGKVSIPALSMDILQKKFGVSGRRVAVVGTGKMASDILKYIQKLGPKQIIVLGRSDDKTAAFAKAFKVRWKNISSIGNVINENDVVVTATSSKDLLVKRGMISGKEQRKVFLDISNPRNVEAPEESDFYDLIDLASLKPILERNRSNKVKEISHAKEIVDLQTESIISKLSKLEMENLIASLYKRAEELKEHEISKLKRALASGVDFEDALEAMSSALVKKLLASQTEVLRNVHGTRVTGDIREAIEGAYFGKPTKTSSKKSRGRPKNQSQQDQTPLLSQKP